jgi:hypothetical protein
VSALWVVFTRRTLTWPCTAAHKQRTLSCCRRRRLRWARVQPTLLNHLPARASLSVLNKPRGAPSLHAKPKRARGAPIALAQSLSPIARCHARVAPPPEPHLFLAAHTCAPPPSLRAQSNCLSLRALPAHTGLSSLPQPRPLPRSLR